MKRDYLKLETITIYRDARMSKEFSWFSDAHDAYLEEIEKRIKIDESVVITLCKLHNGGSQIEIIHCQI